ncbi:hypothetical protein AB0G79_29105 [Streptomyces sp. NPDC020807]|uniref:hypothetical protein n=1 Tax=Streptomyces sp. NPDC020807 TaxID=3155119 RepID=UPI0033E2BB96
MTTSEPRPSADTDAHIDAVREALAREVRGLAPAPRPVPLAELRRAGLARRRRRRTAAAAALSALGVAAAVTVGAESARTGHPAPVPPAAVTPVAPTLRPAPAAPPVRTVAPGERVDAGGGWIVWLTPEGKHTAGPEEYEDFHSVADGNVDTAEPGVTVQGPGGPAGAFRSGLYLGTRDAGRVELTAPGLRPVAATLLELPGHPGWGVWYAHTGPEAYKKELTVTVYDGEGARIASYPR